MIEIIDNVSNSFLNGLKPGSFFRLNTSHYILTHIGFEHCTCYCFESEKFVVLQGSTGVVHLTKVTITFN